MSFVPALPPRASATVAAGIAAVSLCLAGCSSSPSATAAADSASASAHATPSAGTTLDLPVPTAVASIEFTDQDGKQVSLASLHGKTLVISPNLTLCQEFCPLISANLRDVVQAVKAAGLQNQVQVLEVTVDPQRDDLKHLKAYQKLFGVEPNWKFLRASPSNIAAFWRAFHLSYGKADDAPGVAPHDWLTGAPLTYDVDHQNVVYVVGPDGHIQWLIDAAPYLNGAAIPAVLEKFLNREGKSNQSNLPHPNWTAQDVEQALSYVTGKPIGGQ
jgi:protein SCO1/2